MLKKKKLPRTPKKKTVKINEVEEIPKESQISNNENEEPMEKEKIAEISDNNESFDEAPPSSVPLADGTIPILQQEEEKQMELAEKWDEEFQKVPDPTPAQFKAQIAANIAREAANDARERMKIDAETTYKTQQKFKKTADHLLVNDCAELVRKLNSYKQKYKGIINYKFRNHYDITLGFNVLSTECKEVEIILNTQNLPTALKEIGLHLCEIVEIMVEYLGIPNFSLKGLTYDYKVNSDSGFFDSELEQLSIKWASWLAREPEERLAWKLGSIVVRRAINNAPKLIPTAEGVNEKLKMFSNDL